MVTRVAVLDGVEGRVAFRKREHFVGLGEQQTQHGTKQTKRKRQNADDLVRLVRITAVVAKHGLVFVGFRLRQVDERKG